MKMLQTRRRRLICIAVLVILLVCLGAGFWSQSCDYHILGQHNRPVAALAFSPDGKTLYSGCRDAENPETAGKVWEVATGREQQSFRGGAGVTLSPNSRLVATLGEAAQTIDIWDRQTATRRVTLRDTPTYLRQMAISPNAKVLATAGCVLKPDAVLRTDTVPDEIDLWDLSSGEKIRGFGRWGYLSGLSFSPDGKSLASCALDGSIQLWEVASGRELASLAAKEDREVGTVQAVAYSSDGRYLAVAAWKGVFVWEITTRKLVATLPWGGDGPALSLAFSPDGRFLAAGGQYRQWHYLLRGCRVVLWEVRNWQKQSEVKGRIDSGDNVWCIAFSPDSSRLAIGSYQGYVGLMELAR